MVFLYWLYWHYWHTGMAVVAELRWQYSTARWSACELLLLPDRLVWGDARFAPHGRFHPWHLID
ncbi:MAG: hypothetical protein Fur005_31450 [Roseiflexaceae bacterium]